MGGSPVMMEFIVPIERWEYDPNTPELMHSLTNREKRLEPKKGKTFCGSCDMAMVSDGQKCPRCNYRHGVRRFKK